MEIKQFAELLLKGVASENSDVRCHALVHLRKLLVEQQAVFYGLVVAGETVDPLVAKIIAAVCEHE